MEILIKNGTVFDGSGRKGEKRDVLVKDETISAIGCFPKRRAEMVIDASDCYVAPGFIDINSDSDHYLTIFTQPAQISLLKQGITAVLGGNCGSSLAPLIKDNLVSIRKWADPNQVNIDWQTTAEFLEKLEKYPLGVNFGTLIGHSTIRRGLLGEELRDLTEEELKQMKYLIEQALAEGAFGVSTGLSYSHSRITPLYEILEILKIIKKYDGLYSTHLRSEKEGLIAATAELTDLIAELKDAPRIEISHLKSFQGFEDDLNQSLKIIHDLKNQGVDINFDVYPYATTAGPLYPYLPSWVIYGGLELMVKNIRDKVVRGRILKELQEKNYDFSQIIVAEIKNFPDLIGKNIEELAKKRAIAPEEMMLELLQISGGRVIVFERNLSWKGMVSLLRNPLGLVATNGPGRNYEKTPGILPHPRSFGAYPKFLALVRDEKIMNWSEAIRKITFGPAQKIGLKKRGFVQKGYFADLVIFNPEKINSAADYQNPYLEPEGIEFVILNGQLVINKAQFNNISAGRVLRSR